MKFYTNQIKQWKYVLIITPYLIVSWLGFTFTSAGWTALLIGLYGGAFFAGILVLNLIVIGLRRIVFKLKYLSFNKYLFFILLITQFIALLFMQGDCGDSSGSVTFIQQLIKPDDHCWSNIETRNLTASAWFPGGKVTEVFVNINDFVFICSFFLFFLTTLFSRPSNNSVIKSQNENPSN